jgi:hypothetical protein
MVYEYTKLMDGDILPGILSAIFQLYHGDQFQRWKKPEYLESTTDNGQATGKLYHLWLRVKCTLFICPSFKTGRITCHVINLHIIFKVVCSLEPLPTSLSAKHWYVPASDDSKSIIVRDGEDGEVREYFDKLVSTSDISPCTILLQ